MRTLSLLRGALGSLRCPPQLLLCRPVRRLHTHNAQRISKARLTEGTASLAMADSSDQVGPLNAASFDTAPDEVPTREDLRTFSYTEFMHTFELLYAQQRL